MSKPENDLDPLSESEIKEKLKSFPGWEYRENKIFKQFELKDFSSVLDLINNLAPFCNKIDHHPDIHIYYRKVTFELTRFSVGGKVTARDFKVAAEIEKLYKNR